MPHASTAPKTKHGRSPRHSLPVEPQTLNPFVAEWIHFTLLGIILPAIRRKVYTLGGLRTQQLRPEIKHQGMLYAALPREPKTPIIKEHSLNHHMKPYII